MAASGCKVTKRSGREDLTASRRGEGRPVLLVSTQAPRAAFDVLDAARITVDANGQAGQLVGQDVLDPGGDVLLRRVDTFDCSEGFICLVQTLLDAAVDTAKPFRSYPAPAGR